MITLNLPTFRQLSAAGIDYEALPIGPKDAPINPVWGKDFDVKKAGKVPMRFYPETKDWSGFGHWQDHIFSAEEYERMESWPCSGRGVRARLFPAIDGDLGGAAAKFSERLIKRLRAELGSAPCRSRPDERARFLLPFRLAPGARLPHTHVKFTLPFAEGVQQIDFLAATQWVGWGQHPKGAMYEWDRDPAVLGVEELPWMTADLWARAMEIIREEVRNAGGTITHDADARAPGSNHERRKEIGDPSLMAPGYADADIEFDAPVEQQPEAFRVVADALGRINNRKLHRNGKVGGKWGYIDVLRMAVAATGGCAIFQYDVLIPWALSYLPDPGKEPNTFESVERDIAGLGTSGIGWDALAAEAAKYGWRNPYTTPEALFGELPNKMPDEASAPSTRNSSTIVQIRSGLDITPRNVSWLWDGYLAEGKLHVVAGTGGDGKTTIALLVAATISTGSSWPDGTSAPRGDVLVWSGEDDPEDTLLPRFIANGGDRARFHIVGTVQENGRERPFDPAKDIDDLTRAAAALPDLKLIVIDPIVSAVAGDSHKAAEVRRALLPIIRFADETGCAVVGVAHFNKASAGKSPLERVNGSGAFGQAGRIVYGTARCEGDGDHRVIVRAKSNIGPDGDGWQYRLERVKVLDEIEAQRAVWEKPLKGRARNLLNDAEGVADEPKRTSRTDEAKSFLLGLLTNGPILVTEIEDAAEAAGHAWVTIKRAKKSAGIVSKKDADGWRWAIAGSIEEVFAEENEAA